MSTIYQKITTSLGVQAAEEFVDSMQNESAYYVFAGKHTPYIGNSDDVIPSPTDTVSDAAQHFHDMMFGKRITSNDVVTMIKRYNWSSGTVYDMYDDTDTELADGQYFVVVPNGVIEYNVYKCLFNNRGGASTVEPSGKDTSAVEYPNDGYIWKYMYSISSANMTKFGTSAHVPVIPDSDVTDAAVDGAIDVIYVDDIGYGYNNYTTGNIPSSDSIYIDGNQLQFGLANNAAGTPDYYNDCLMLLTSGSAANEYRLITDYYIDSGQKIVVIESPFSNTVSVGDSYEIYPFVYVYDTGATSTANCIARAVINASSSNSISKIEILATGAGYTSAVSKIKTSNTVNVITEVGIRPILPPAGGHGYNINNELGSRHVGVSVQFVGNTTPLSANNDYRTIGIIREPRFANVNVLLNTSKIIGNFVTDETVSRYKPIRLSGNVNIYSNTTVVGDGTFFTDALRVGDRVIITDGITNAIGNVSTITSDSALTLAANAAFTGSNCSITIMDTSYFGIVTDYDTASVSLTSVAPSGYLYNSNLLGETSLCTAAISNVATHITVSNRNANQFPIFTQLTKFIGTHESVNDFTEDEIVNVDIGAVTDEETQPTLRYHSLVENSGSANDYLFCTNIVNSITLPCTLRGTTSNAVFTAVTRYDGEIIPHVGEILYVEHLEPISRDPAQTETIKLTLEF